VNARRSPPAFNASAPDARRLFAARLRQLRAESGFPTARQLATALVIEENRYTRYERAEVEPSLTLIRRICETLRVSPNELLGYSHPTRNGAEFPDR
jgi:transcriptional regulator with XRE-family HTH domain